MNLFYFTKSEDGESTKFEADHEVVDNIRYIVKPYIDLDTNQIKFEIREQTREELDNGTTAWANKGFITSTPTIEDVGHYIRDSFQIMAFY